MTGLMMWVVRGLAVVVITAIVSSGAIVQGQALTAQSDGRSLADALSDLQARGLRIIYSSEVVRPDMRVTTAPRATALRRMLDEILTPHGLIAQDGPGGRVLVVKNPRVRIDKTPVSPKPSTIAPPLSDEAVEIPRFAETVDVTGSQSWDAGLGAPSFMIQPMDVRAFAGGFDNIFRTLQALPGIAATDELGSKIAVRGGAPDQNLTVLDGVEIHNPYRVYVPSEDLGMAGLASAFNLDTIESVELSPGAFDVRHGDRLSSVLIVKQRNGSSTEAFQGTSSFSLTDANVALEGRLPQRTNGSWLISARRTHFDLVVDRVLGLDLPSFHDVQAKVAWQPAVGHRVSLLALSGRERTRARDDVAVDDEIHSTKTHNTLLAATFESSIAPRISSRTIASFAQFDDAFDIHERSLSNSRAANTESSIGSGGPVEFQLSRNVAVGDLAVKQEFTLRPTDRHALDLGLDTHWLDTRWSWHVTGDRSPFQANGTSVRLGASLPGALDSSRDSYRIGAWLQDRWHLTPRVMMQPGVRVDRSSLTGQTTVSPRLSAAFDAGDATRVAAAVRLHSQTPGYEKLFQSDYFVDLSDGNTEALQAERALHVVGGIQHAFQRGVSVRVDGYYRRFADLLVGRLESEEERLARLARYDVPLSLWSHVPTRPEITTSPVNAGTGRAYGLELYLARNGGASTPLSGWASYTFARANRTVYGMTHPFDYDRRHAVSAAANLKIGPRIDVSATGRWGTGYPRTAVQGVRLALVPDASDEDRDGNAHERVPQRDAHGHPIFQPDLGDLANINAARLPYFARVDVRVTYRPTWSRERWAFYLDVMNIFNRKNVVLIDSALVYDPGSDRPGIIELAEDRGIPFFPSFGIRFWF